MNLVFVDNEEIRKINRRFLGKNTITDVIAFPLKGKIPPDDIDGEIIISAQESVRQSRQRHIPFEQELLLYCIHGVLHLIGYDDTTEQKRLKMQSKQSYYLKLALRDSPIVNSK
jgi:rRNA maturation RNase YbeY